MKTIAKQLKVTEFPFEIHDKNGNQIYYEDSDGDWYKNEFDSDDNVIYFENSKGTIKDNRSKPHEGKVVEVDGVKYELKSIN